MSEIIKIGLTKNHNQEIIEVTEVDVVKTWEDFKKRIPSTSSVNRL